MERKALLPISIYIVILVTSRGAPLNNLDKIFMDFFFKNQNCSAHTNLVDVWLNSTMCLISLITGTVKPTPLPWLHVLANIEPPALRRKVSTDKLQTKAPFTEPGSCMVTSQTPYTPVPIQTTNVGRCLEIDFRLGFSDLSGFGLRCEATLWDLTARSALRCRGHRAVLISVATWMLGGLWNFWQAV